MGENRQSLPASGAAYAEELLSFYRGKRVLITGHTGFKGSWMLKVLREAGAEVMGYALEPPTDPSLFVMIGGEHLCRSVTGDIRDFARLKNAFDAFSPEIVIHLAAQPIVRDSYRDPVYTYETNVMGTVHLLECVRTSSCVRSFLNVTTDKVYRNREWEWGYRENEMLDGFDPYSNSKSCSELVTHSYRDSFFSQDGSPRISTARAGNVIGGGDFAHDRIVPDCVRAVAAGRPVPVRNPHSTRPYQHVLEPVFAYLMIAKEQYENPQAAGCYNVGPDDVDCVTTEEIVRMFCRCWGKGASWEVCSAGGPHEASFLKLDCSRLKHVFGWRPRWHIGEAVAKTVEWTACWLEKGDVSALMSRQIREFMLKE